MKKTVFALGARLTLECSGPQPVVLSLMRLDQKCSCCGGSITQEHLEGPGRDGCGPALWGGWVLVPSLSPFLTSFSFLFL